LLKNSQKVKNKNLCRSSDNLQVPVLRLKVMDRSLLCITAVMMLSACAGPRAASHKTTAEGILSRTGGSVQPDTAEPRSSLPPGVDLAQPLSADDVVGIAIWNNPQLRADLATIGLAEADLVDAGLLRNPRLDMLVPVGAKPFELLLNFPVEVFWQRPRRIAASQQALDQLAQSLIQNGLNTARDARWAHADVVQALDRAAVAKQSVELRERVSKLSEVRLRAGDISELETIAARNESALAEEQHVRFEHDVLIATERLRAALGFSAERPDLQVKPSVPTTEAPPPIESLLEKAMTARPDLRAAELAIATATKRAKWERSRILLLSAQLSSKEVGANGVLTGPGVGVELPVFHRNQGLIARAEAEVEVASQQYVALKQRVALEVAEARQQLVQALDALKAVREQVLPPLRRAVALAEEQYKKGDVAYLFVLEQNRGLIDAQLRIVDSEAAIRRARAQLERSVGSKYD
jgi:cobalt-zinc-cadmium efflux system outer membrane protein